MKQVKLHWLILSICFVQTGLAQTNFWNTKDAYLGQKPPADDPQVFAPGMLADSGIVLGRVTFSQDGKEFYYSFARHWFDSKGSGTKQIRFDGQKWQKPTVIASDLTNPALSSNGKTLYLGAPQGVVWTMSRSPNGWTMSRSPNGWTKPQFWMEKKYGLYNFQATSSGTFYTGSNGMQGSKSDYSTYDFCTLTLAKNDTVIKSLTSPLNTPAFDGDFFIAPDESYIIISTKETKNYECELWISFRKKDKTWTEPVSLGDKNNAGLAHRFGQYVSPDNRYLFYTKGTSEKDCNIYWVRFDALLTKLKPKNL